MIQANADGIYDARDNFNTLDKMKITPAIKIHENANTRARGCPLRKKHVLEYKRLGYKRWRDKYRTATAGALRETFRPSRGSRENTL